MLCGMQPKSLLLLGDICEGGFIGSPKIRALMVYRTPWLRILLYKNSRLTGAISLCCVSVLLYNSLLFENVAVFQFTV